MSKQTKPKVCPDCGKFYVKQYGHTCEEKENETTETTGN